MIKFSKFYELLEEDLQSSVNQAKKILLSNGFSEEGATEAVENLKSIVTGPIGDQLSPQQKRFNTDSNIPILAYLLLYVKTTTGSPYAALENEYSLYLNSPSATGNNVLVNSFNELKQTIQDKKWWKPSPEKQNHISQWGKDTLNKITQYSKHDINKTKTDSEPENDVVYEDDTIIIYLADTKQKSQKYGDELLCIGVKTGENYFWRYRTGKYVKGVGMSTYFIYWKNNDNKILVDALGLDDESFNTYSYNRYNWNGEENNNDTMSAQDGSNQLPASIVIEEFPDLEKPFEQGVFKFIPFGKKEKRIVEIEQTVHDVTALSDFEDIGYFLDLGKQVNIDEWKYLEGLFIPKQMKELMEKYAGLGGILAPDLLDKYFNSLEVRRYMYNMSKSPERAYNYYRFIRRNGVLPEGFVDVIAEDPKYAYKYASDERGKNLPQSILDSITKDPSTSYRFLDNVLGVPFEQTPREFIDSILTSPEYSYKYVFNMFPWENADVPREFVDAIIKSPLYAYKYAANIMNVKGENISEEVVKAFAENAEYAYRYTTGLFPDDFSDGVVAPENVPDFLLKSIAKEPEWAYKYAIKVLHPRGLEIPDYFIKTILRDPRTTVDLLINLETKPEDVPREYVNTIATDYVASYSFALEVLHGIGVPMEVTNAIASNADYAGYYAEYLHDRGTQPVPDSIIAAIATSGSVAYSYLARVLRFKDAPQIIINAAASTLENIYQIAGNIDGVKLPENAMEILAKNSYTANKYVTNVLKYENIPDVILNSILEDPEYAFSYAKHLTFKDKIIPSKVVDSIKKSGYFASRYIIEILQHHNVSDDLLDAVRRYDPQILVRHYIETVKRGEQIPEDAIELISNSSKNSIEYVEALDGVRGGTPYTIPVSIIHSIEMSAKTLLRYVRIAYLNKGQLPPLNYSNIISHSDDLVNTYAIDLMERGLSIPEIVIHAIAEDSYSSYQYAKYLKDSGADISNIPDIIMNSIANDVEYSYSYSRLLNFENIPDNILRTVSNRSRYAKKYAIGLLPDRTGTVPEIILKGIAEDPSMAYSYAKELIENDLEVPNIIEKSIIQNAQYLLQYIRLKKYETVPEEYYEALTKDANASYSYAKSLRDAGKPIPDIIFKGIAENPEVAYEWAYYNPTNTPDIIVKSLIKDENYAYYYAESLKGNNQPIPDFVIDVIAKNPSNAAAFAMYLLKGVDVPDVLINSIVSGGDSNSNRIWEYVAHIDPQLIPPPIINELAKYPDLAFKYVRLFLKYKNVPEVLVNSMQSDEEVWRKYQTEITTESFFKLPKAPKSFNMLYERIITYVDR